MCNTKICSKCEIRKPLIEFHPDNRTTTKVTHKASCKACHQLYVIEYCKRTEVKNKKRLQSKTYYEKNKDKVLENSKVIHANRTKEQITAKRKYSKKRSSLGRVNLQDYYIVSQLKKQKIPTEDITPELIEIKRLQITLKREIKNEKSKQIKQSANCS